MQVVIPTYQRARLDVQHTYRTLLAAGVQPILVVREEEHHHYLRIAPTERIAVIPKTHCVSGIADTRDWIIYDMPHDTDRVCMLDDDLQFAVRRGDDPTKFRKAEIMDITIMMSAIDATLTRHPHVGIGAREGGNRNTETLLWNTRMMRVLAYDRKIIKQHGLRFHPMKVMEDFHMSLSLLRLGYDLPVLNSWVSNQAGGSQAPGGCSSFRTDDIQEENALKLAYLHRPFVKVVQKTTKTAWGGKTRTDVMVQWKKARESANANS